MKSVKKKSVASQFVFAIKTSDTQERFTKDRMLYMYSIYSIVESMAGYMWSRSFIGLVDDREK